MKILVISLLRLGDFLQVVPVVNGLKEKYRANGARVDLLTHLPVAGLKPLLPDVGRWWTLDRDELQAGLGRADIPLLTSFDVLKEQLEQISSEDYDLVINLTQTEFSGWITGFLNAKEKLGLAFTPRGRALFHSPWFRYLDRHAQIKSDDVFNYTDIFWQACGLGDLTKQWPLHSPRSPEIDSLKLENRPTLVAQLMTSDPKKNWPEANWIRLLNDLRGRHPNWNYVLLGAPNERQQVERVAAATGATVAIVSLPAALDLLNRAEVLVTGDTSIKHLANAAKARVVELSLGPSDLQRTGIYKADSLILQPQMACAPCPHSAPCSQATHACAMQLASSMVAAAVEAFMRSDWTALTELARLSAPIAFLRTRHLATGYWFAADLTSRTAEQTLERLLDRCTWKFWLNREYRRPLIEFGSASVHLQDEIQRLFPTAARPPLLAHLDFLDRDLSQRQETAVRNRDRFVQAQVTSNAQVNLSEIRRCQEQVEEEARQIEIKMKLIRSLKSRWMENT